MLAQGFTVEQMVELVRAGLVTATTERIRAGPREIEVARVQITETGRKRRSTDEAAKLGGPTSSVRYHEA
jgi:hypothetical protein